MSHNRTLKKILANIDVIELTTEATVTGRHTSFRVTLVAALRRDRRDLFDSFEYVIKGHGADGGDQKALLASMWATVSRHWNLLRGCLEVLRE